MAKSALPLALHQCGEMRPADVRGCLRKDGVVRDGKARQACLDARQPGTATRSTSTAMHMMLRIPPKFAVSQVVGYINGKSAIQLARVQGECKRNFAGQHFRARGYFSTVGRTKR